MKKKIVIAMPIETDFVNTIEKWAAKEDFSKSELVFTHYVRQEYSGYEMTVVSYPDEKVFAEMKPVLENHFRAICTNMLKAGTSFKVEVFLSPSPADSMIKTLVSSKADLVVVATRGKTGLAGFFGSSFADHMNKFSPCDILVLRPRH